MTVPNLRLQTKSDFPDGFYISLAGKTDPYSSPVGFVFDGSGCGLHGWCAKKGVQAPTNSSEVRCLRRVLHIDTVPSEVQVAASMSLTPRALGIGTWERTRDAAHWGCWADFLEMIKIRHPNVARRVVQGMATRSSRCFQAVEEAASRLRVMGVDTQNWETLSAGLRSEEGRTIKHRERDPTEPRHGGRK